MDIIKDQSIIIIDMKDKFEEIFQCWGEKTENMTEM